MITKERLQELINQKATIWHDDFGEIKLSEKCEILDTFGFDYKHQPIEGSILRFYYIYDNQPHFDDYDITELEEDVEKARWHYEIDATRRELFSPPTWKEMLENPIVYRHYSKNGIEIELCIGETVAPDGRKTKPFVRVDYGYKSRYFEKSKKGWLKACELARNLFLGVDTNEWK